MDKEKIRLQFQNQISADIALLTQAALAAKEAAIHSESKAEDQYDTRGLEASYLAGAQAKRVLELEDLLTLFRTVDLRSFGSSAPISSTALVELNGEGKMLYCFLMPKGGGRSTQFEGKTIQITSAQSPLGAALIGKKQGDTVEIQTPTSREYEVSRVW